MATKESTKISLQSDHEINSCKDAAMAVLKWSIDSHLVDQALDFGTIQAQALTASDGTLLEPNNNYTEVLRSRKISGVLYNERSGRVIILTRRKISIRSVGEMPNRVGNYLIEYLNIGIAQAGAPASQCNGTGYFEHNGYYCCGSSIHPARYPGAGTMGALLKDKDGVIYGLSNNHVTGMCNYSDEGEKILAPGHIDIASRSKDPFTIGTHHLSLNMVSGLPSNVDVKNNTDAAVFKIRDINTVSSLQGTYYDTPSTLAFPMGGMVVEKVGRTTGHTRGVICGESTGPLPVGYTILPISGNSTSYFDRIFVVIGENGAPFSSPGDSGSLVTSVDNNGNRVAVGVVFAGTGTGASYILPISPILKLLQMDIVSEHNI